MWDTDGNEKPKRCLKDLEESESAEAETVNHDCNSAFKGNLENLTFLDIFQLILNLLILFFQITSRTRKIKSVVQAWQGPLLLKRCMKQSW